MRDAGELGALPFAGYMATSSDIHLAAGGDRRAFERLYHAHLDRVYSLACRMAGRQAADELTQDVFVRVWQRLATFRGESAFTTWLHRLAVNVIVEYFRRENVRRGRESNDLAAIDLAPARTASAGVRLDLDNALEQLPSGARRVFVLYDVEGYTHVEIAELLGTSVGTSKSQLHRARTLLRGHLVTRPNEA